MIKEYSFIHTHRALIEIVKFCLYLLPKLLNAETGVYVFTN